MTGPLYGCLLSKLPFPIGLDSLLCVCLLPQCNTPPSSDASTRPRLRALLHALLSHDLGVVHSHTVSDGEERIEPLPHCEDVLDSACGSKADMIWFACMCCRTDCWQRRRCRWKGGGRKEEGLRFSAVHAALVEGSPQQVQATMEEIYKLLKMPGIPAILNE